MRKVPAFLLVFILFFIGISAIPSKKEKVNWLNLAQLKEAYEKNPKPIIFDLYTDWCGWCKVMDSKTYGEEKVAKYINENYYAVKFNAETKDSVEFAGRKFGYNAQYKLNELCAYLTYGEIGFPVTVLLADIKGQPAPLVGYLKPKELEGPLKFFGDGAYKSQNYKEFEKNFASSW